MDSRYQGSAQRIERGEVMDIEQMRKDFEEYAKSNLLITESYGFLSEPSASRLFKAGWQAAHAHYAKPAAPVVWPEPDMFWDDKDRDNCLDSVAEVVAAASYNRGLEIGDEILICRALNLPVITIRITKVSDENGELAPEWEENDC